MENSDKKKELHIPVMLQELLEIAPKGKGKALLDCTFGVGGHSFAIAEQLKKSVIIGVDLDEESIDMSVDVARSRGWKVMGPAGEKLFGWKLIDAEKNVLYLVKHNFADLNGVLNELKIRDINLALFDLGFSTFQLERLKRGFGYTGREELLDQRYDVTTGWRACDLVNMLSERELAILFETYGEEGYAKAIAKAIAFARKNKPIETNKELSNIIRKTVKELGKSERGKHPAAKVFQALRIAVNNEIFSLASALPQAFEHLVAGRGKMVIITFHSIERKVVEEFLKEKKGSALESKRTPSFGEVAKNPSSRSAVMYVIGKK